MIAKTGHRPVEPGVRKAAEREPRRVRLRIRATALAALAVSAVYLTWRAASTLDLSAWWLSLPLLGLEGFAALSLALFTFSVWDVDAAPPVPVRRRARAERVAVVVCAAGHPAAVLMATVAAAVALEPGHDTWVLDDEARPEIRRLARDLGARHVVVPGGPDGLAAAVDAVLPELDAGIVAVLEGDQIPGPNLLAHTLGYFDDPGMAAVQTAHDFADRDAAGVRRASEHALVQRLLQPGRNRWGAALWRGTGAVLRVAALREIGGVAAGTGDRPLHTTIRLHRAGWRTVFHPEVLAVGLTTPAASRQDRLRLGTAAMEVLRLDNPLRGPGLTAAQRLAHTATLVGWFEAWRSLGYLLVPPLVLLTGGIPLRVGLVAFAFAFTVTFCIQRLAMLELARDRMARPLSAVFELVRMPVDLRATLALFGAGLPRPPAAAAGADGRHPGLPALRLIAWLLALSAVWFILSSAGLTPVRYEAGWVTWSAVVWLYVNALLLARALRQIAAEQAIGERRAAVRFDVELTALLGDFTCNVTDMSLAGAGVLLPGSAAAGIEVGDSGPFIFELGGPFVFDVTVRSIRMRPDETVAIGVEFDRGQERERARLALALFHSNAARRLVPETGSPAPVPAVGAAAA